MINKSNIKVRQFINSCKTAYGKPIDPKQNVMEAVTKDIKVNGKTIKGIDIQKVKGFTWKNMGQAWGMAEADLLKTVTKETGSLRVLWYRSFKLYAMRVMKNDVDLDKANAILSQSLASLVRTGEYLYEDFCIEDFAYNKNFKEFIQNLNVVLFVEKSSEMPKFTKSCEILGIKVIMAGSGRPNFSSSEYIFTNFFKNSVTEHNPIRILTLSDFDFDGVIPIAGAFIKQMQHYSPHVKSARIGLNSNQIPENRQSADDALYMVKQENKNKPKEAWMEENLFKNKNGKFLGAEVESMEFKFYYPLIWDALKETGVTYQMFLDQKYKDIQPDIRAAAKDIAIGMLKNDLEGIDNQITELNKIRSEMILNKMEEIKPVALQVKNDPTFIEFQKPKDEDSIYVALKQQKSWTGGLQYGKQVVEFKRRVKNLIGI